jgi:surface carbohydrate biosynthesis protein
MPVNTGPTRTLNPPEMIMAVADHPIAYLTCELKGRDFASRLLIASLLLDAGYAVVVGQQWSLSLNVPTAPRGCYLFKSSNFVQARFMGECKRAGHIVVVADEECLASSRIDVARSTHPDTFAHADAFLAINEVHRDAYVEAYPAAAPLISVVGNARVDILRNTRRPRPREREYVLINTSFGIINSMWGDAAHAAKVWVVSGGHAPGPETDALVRERIAFEEAALKETRDLIAWLLANTRLDIVIRPHPQELPGMWAALDAARISVVSGSDPMAWMRHAILTIHSESTTGVEAAIMGARVLNLSPPQAWNSRLIVSEVNPTAATAVEASALIEKLLADGTWPAAATDPTNAFPPGGARKTAEAIMRMLPPPGPLPPIHWSRLERGELQKKKFTADIEEVHAQLKCRAAELDDSIFFLEPYQGIGIAKAK